MIKLLLTLSLLFSILSLSQTYKGKVTDTKNKPIAFADVIAIKNNGEMITGVNSNDKGNFELTISSNEPFYLEISFIGYKTKKITPTKTDLGTITLKEQATQLKTVVIKSQKNIIVRKVDRLVFNVANSIQASAGDAMEVLKVTPSIRVRNDRITMIGKSGMQVMVNDRLIRLSGDELVNYLASIPSDNIKNIEVITAPPAKYDANGNSGLININLKKAPNNSWNATLSSYFRQRTYALGYLGATFMYNKDKLSVISTIGHRRGTRFSDYQTDAYFNNEIWKTKQLPINPLKSTGTRIDINYQLTNKWSVGGQYGYRLFDIKSLKPTISKVFDRTKNNQLIKELESKQNDRRNYTMNSFNFNNSFKINKNKKITFDIDYFNFQDTQTLNYNGTQKDLELSKSQFYNGRNDNNQNIANLSCAIDFSFNTNIAKFNFGGKITNTKSHNNLSYFNSGLVNQLIQNKVFIDNDFEYNENIQALYFSVNKKIGEKLNIKGGLRMENTATKSISENLNFNKPNKYVKWFPTFYLSYNTTDKSIISLSYNKRIQRPRFSDLNPNERYNNPFYLVKGNPFLQPAYIDNLEFSHSFKKLNSKLYYSYEDNMYSQIPISDSSSNTTVYTNENYMNRQHYGISESYRFKKFRWWSSTNSLDFSYSLSTFNLKKTRKNKKGYNSTFSTNNSFVFNDNKTFKGGVNFWYNFPGIDGIFETKYASSMSLSLQYLMLNKDLTLSLRANDVFRTSGERAEAVINGVIQKVNYYYDSQYFQVSLTYKFGNRKIKAKRNKTGNKEERRRI